MIILQFASAHGLEHFSTSCISRGLKSVKILSVLLTSLEHRALLEQIHETNRLSCQVDSFQTRRAVIGNRLEKFHADSFWGLCCHQLPFQSERVHRCVVLGLAHQPYSNLAKENSGKKKGQESLKKENLSKLFILIFFLLSFFFAPSRTSYIRHRPTVFSNLI